MGSGYPYAVPHPAPPAERPELPEGESPYPRWPLWFALAAPAVGFVIAMTAFLILAVIVGAIEGHVGRDSVALTDLATLAQDVIFVATAVWFAARVARPRPWMFGLRGARFWRTIGWMVVGLVSYYLLAAIYQAAVHPNGKQTITQDLGTGKSTLTLVAGALLVIVVAPVCEEIFFRGFFFRVLRNRLSFAVAAAIDGVVFGVIHAGATDPLTLPVLAILGFAFCLVYERTGTIFATIALHSFNNALAFGVNVHGGGVVAAVAGGTVIACCVAAVARLPGRDPALA